VMAGESNDPAVSGSSQFAIAKLNNAGQLDPSFNGTGILNINIASSINEEVRALKALSDGSILAAGTSFSSSRAQEFRMVKVGANGTLVSTFGTSGVAAPVNFFAGFANDIPSSIAVLSDNSIVLGGYGVQLQPSPTPSQTYMTLAKFTSSGIIDTTFGTAGVKFTLFGTNGSNTTPLDIQVFNNDALLHVGWAAYTNISQSNNIVLYKTIP
jgi:uncharacterized delta-60 repeat protein